MLVDHLLLAFLQFIKVGHVASTYFNFARKSQSIDHSVMKSFSIGEKKLAKNYVVYADNADVDVDDDDGDDEKDEDDAGMKDTFLFREVPD